MSAMMKDVIYPPTQHGEATKTSSRNVTSLPTSHPSEIMRSWIEFTLQGPCGMVHILAADVLPPLPADSALYETALRDPRRALRFFSHH